MILGTTLYHIFRLAVRQSPGILSMICLDSEARDVHPPSPQFSHALTFHNAFTSQSSDIDLSNLLISLRSKAPSLYAKVPSISTHGLCMPLELSCIAGAFTQHASPPMIVPPTMKVLISFPKYRKAVKRKRSASLWIAVEL